jgi:hypothetical protein
MITWKLAVRKRDFTLKLVFRRYVEDLTNGDIRGHQDMVNSPFKANCVIRPLGISRLSRTSFLVVIVDTLKFKRFFCLLPCFVGQFVVVTLLGFQKLRFLVKNAFAVQQIKCWRTWQRVEIAAENQRQINAMFLQKFSCLGVEVKSLCMLYVIKFWAPKEVAVANNKFTA